jgi:hypothetical protein
MLAVENFGDPGGYDDNNSGEENTTQKRWILQTRHESSEFVHIVPLEPDEASLNLAGGSGL